MGFVYDKLYTSFSGAVDRDSPDDGSRESSYLEKSEVCGLELLSSNYDDDNDNEEHDDLDSIEEEGVYIPPQSQSNSLLGVPSQILPSQILTFPTSQTTNSEDDTVTGDGLNDTQFLFQQTQRSSDSDRLGDGHNNAKLSFQQTQLSTSLDIEIGARDSNRLLSTEIESDEEEEVIAEEGVDGTDAGNAQMACSGWICTSNK
jgi:hypothetical protein